MKTKTVNISFQGNLLKEIDAIARRESRTRSELIREAARLYIERKQRWEDIFSFGNKQVNNLDLKEEDVEEAITRYRRRKRKSR